MSRIAGIDFSTKAIDIVLIDEDDTEPVQWHRWPVNATTPFYAARRISHYLPTPGWWEDHDVYLIGIEQPFGRHIKGLVPLMRMQGAIVARLPREICVLELPVSEWKREFTGKGNASKTDVFLQATRYDIDGLIPWLDCDEKACPQDAVDAYAIAYAARTINTRALQRKEAA